VVHRIYYGEADRILKLLTPDHGVLSVIAKSVRREKSKLAGNIELFTLSDVTIHEGRGDMGVLTGARLQTYFMHILEDYDRLQLGYEAIKQIKKVADIVPEPAFFSLLLECFVSLDDKKIPLKLVESWLWLQLAILLGVGLNLSIDNAGEKMRVDQRYDFDDGTNEFIPRESGRFTADHIKLLRLLSAQSPRVAAHVTGVANLIDDCHWVAQRLHP
jgi:DNA repair protein RecO (recombination protein O)